MAYTSSVSEKNEPGYTKRVIQITLDGEEAIANFAYTSPTYVDPEDVAIHQTVQASDGSVVTPVLAFDADNAQIDFSFDVEGGGDTAGAAFTFTVKFPAGADQDGDSVFGSGNTGPTFDS